jgi:hypothetical protein
VVLLMARFDTNPGDAHAAATKKWQTRELEKLITKSFKNVVKWQRKRNTNC